MNEPAFLSRVSYSAPELLRLFSGCPIFRPLGEQLKPLALASFARTIRLGEPLFRAGQPAEHLFLVLSGLLKVVQFSEDGSEVILGIFGARELVGLLPTLQNKPHKTSAIALSEHTRVLCISGAVLLDLASRNTETAMALSQALLQQNQLLHDTIDVLSAGAVPRRLAALLLRLAERFGDEMEDGTTRVPLTLSRGELSSLINARSETTIRVLSRWRKQGILETSQDGFSLIAPARLREILDGERAAA